MVLYDPIGVDGRQRSYVWLIAMETVRGTGEGPLERVLIADVRQASVFAELLLMEGQYLCPARSNWLLHFASSLSVLRYCFATSL